MSLGFFVQSTQESSPWSPFEQSCGADSGARVLRVVSGSTKTGAVSPPPPASVSPSSLTTEHRFVQMGVAMSGSQGDRTPLSLSSVSPLSWPVVGLGSAGAPVLTGCEWGLVDHQGCLAFRIIRTRLGRVPSFTLCSSIFLFVFFYLNMGVVLGVLQPAVLRRHSVKMSAGLLGTWHRMLGGACVPGRHQGGALGRSTSRLAVWGDWKQLGWTVFLCSQKHS